VLLTLHCFSIYTVVAVNVFALASCAFFQLQYISVVIFVLNFSMCFQIDIVSGAAAGLS